MEHIIEVKNLEKSYKNVKAVDDISFYVEKGKLFAFLGPNGAGKSTTISTICTFLQPDAGEVTVNGFALGKENDKIRDNIGVVFQESVLDNLLTVEENLELRGSLYNLRGKKLKEAINKAVEATDLKTFLKRPYGKLSGGQRRRADIARALIHTPQILFLDEPTTGLDPQTRKSVWETIRKLQNKQQMTVFLTTHYMEEAEKADYCIVIDEGKIAAKGTPMELREKYAKDTLEMVFKNGTIKEQALENTMDALPVLIENKECLEGFTVVRGSMDDVFLGITGKEIRE